MAQHEEAPLWRSQIIVPVNVEQYVAKAHLRGADAIILDLEAIEAVVRPGIRALMLPKIDSASL